MYILLCGNIDLFVLYFFLTNIVFSHLKLLQDSPHLMKIQKSHLKKMKYPNKFYFRNVSELHVVISSQLSANK